MSSELQESERLLAEMLRCLYGIEDTETIQAKMDGIELHWGAATSAPLFIAWARIPGCPRPWAAGPP